MPISRNFLFVLIILGAMFLVLAAGGALPLIVQAVTAVAQGIGSFVMGLIRR